LSRYLLCFLLIFLSLFMNTKLMYVSIMRFNDLCDGVELILNYIHYRLRQQCRTSCVTMVNCFQDHLDHRRHPAPGEVPGLALSPTVVLTLPACALFRLSRRHQSAETWNRLSQQILENDCRYYRLTFVITNTL